MGTNGSSAGQLYLPYDVALDNQGYIYVADYGNGRVEKFNSATGVYITQWNGTGSKGQLYQPYSIAVDSSANVYVTDYSNYKVVKFTSNGTYIAQWGSYGTGNGQFYYPTGVTVDAFGYVYVADSQNNRIQKFVPSTTLSATADNGAAVNLNITGTIDASQMSNLKITSSQTTKTTTLSFTVTGQSGMSGFGIVTIPKSAVASGTTPTVSIDGAKIQNQFYTQDTNNYYVWYNTHFSTHEITIQFTDSTPTESSLATSIVIVCAAVILAILLIGAFKMKKWPFAKRW